MLVPTARQDKGEGQSQAKGADQPQQRNGLSEAQGRVEDVHPRMDGILQVRLREEFPTHHRCMAPPPHQNVYMAQLETNQDAMYKSDEMWNRLQARHQICPHPQRLVAHSEEQDAIHSYDR